MVTLCFSMWSIEQLLELELRRVGQVYTLILLGIDCKIVFVYRKYSSLMYGGLLRGVGWLSWSPIRSSENGTNIDNAKSKIKFLGYLCVVWMKWNFI